MNKQKKPFKYYALIFIFSSLIITAYSLYMIIVKEVPVSNVSSLWFMPIIFTVLLWGSDTIIFKLSNKKKTVDYEGRFLNEISEKMRQSNDFLVEDFRRLQINTKFQEDLKRAYNIYKNGEDEIFTISKLEHKYKKNTIESKAMKYVIDYLEESQNLPKTE